MALVWLLAWFGLGVVLMFFAVSVQYDDRKFFRLISKILRFAFFPSWEAYIAIQERAKIDKADFDEYRIREFPAPETVFTGIYLSAIKDVRASEKEIYFACKLFKHIKKTSYLFNILEKMHYSEIVYGGDDFLYKYHYPAELSVRRIIKLLLAFPTTAYQDVERWQSDVIRYGDRHYYIKIEEITDSKEVIANMKRGH